MKREPDGTEEVVPETPLAPMSEADIGAAAASDLDNLPMTPEWEGQLRPVPRVKTLRRALGLTQEEFSARYHIPLGTLRDWEQGRSQPDQPARVFLAVIARAPKEVAELLLPESLTPPSFDQEFLRPQDINIPRNAGLLPGSSMSLESQEVQRGVQERGEMRKLYIVSTGHTKTAENKMEFQEKQDMPLHSIAGGISQ
jgi:putative transcriptional regulator